MSSSPNRPAWRKSSYSGGNGDCVEVADRLHGVVAVRDSKDPEGSRLVFAAAEWREFVLAIQAGAFDPR